MSQPEAVESEVGKPSRTYTKWQTGLNISAAWLTLWASMWLGVAMASIIVPLMVAMIAALLGLYQVVGNMDLRALKLSEPRRARRRRDQVEAE